jgi:rfaE bifunctional protein kinase chain/domain
MIGNVERISPEAPVPVVTITHKENRPGGAANVALNLQALGAEPVICSVAGRDNMGIIFSKLMEDNNLSSAGLIYDDNRITTCKTRVIGHNQQLLRVDEETTEEISSLTEQKLITVIKNLMSAESIDAVIFEDYDKGVVTPSLIGNVVNLAASEQIPVCADPKKKNFGNYKNVTLFKPNFKEITEGLKIDIQKTDIPALAHAVAMFHKASGNKLVMITLSEMGVFISDGRRFETVPASVRDIADVSGAGDTVISVATLCLTAGIDIYDIAIISNLAGGLVCEKVGVVPVNKEQLLNECLRLYGK